MSPMKDRLRGWDDAGWALLVARLVFGGVMIAFALPKIAEPLDFLKVLYNYHILPAEPAVFLNLVALWIPWIELLGSLAIILGIGRRGVSALFVVLMVVFTSAVLYRAIVMYGDLGGAFCDIKFDCGCGQGEVYICTKVLENIGLTLLAFYCLISRSNRFALTKV